MYFICHQCKQNFKRDELENLCDLSSFLDEIIDHQKYPIKAAENINKGKKKFRYWLYWFAHYLAKKGYTYEQKLKH